METSHTNKVAASFLRSDSRGVSTTQHPFGGRNMFTSLRETNPVSEYRNPASRSFGFSDSSINRCLYFVVSGILAGVAVILLNSHFLCIEQLTWALQKYASILGEIDKVCTIYGCGWDRIEPENSKLLKWRIPVRDNSGLGSCYADRDSDTLSNGRGRDRLFANKESDVIEAVERESGRQSGKQL